MTSEHPVTHNEAATGNIVDQEKRYRQLAEHDALAGAIAIGKTRGTYVPSEHVNEQKFPPLTIAEYLEMLALGENLARYYRHPSQVDKAVKAGATWEQIAAATGTTEAEARDAYREWAEEQHRLFADTGRFGLDDARYAAAVEAAGEPVPGAAAGGGTAVGVLRSAADALAVDLATWQARDPGDPSPEARQARKAAIATADAVTTAMFRLRARLEGGRP
jgi:hypothetical protein